MDYFFFKIFPDILDVSKRNVGKANRKNKEQKSLGSLKMFKPIFGSAMPATVQPYTMTRQ